MYNKISKMTQEQLRMQMLAGIITEGEYKAKLNENEEMQAYETDSNDPDYINHINIVFNRLKQAGYNLPSVIVDDMEDLYYDFDYRDYFTENGFGADMTLQDAKQTINDLIEENPSELPEYENYNSVEDFKA
jgi:beta-glucosidase/6-phospho-beta-glucosidase/beta-galactosidase